MRLTHSNSWYYQIWLGAFFLHATVVVGQMDTLVMGNVVFDSAETLSFGGIFVKLLEDDLLLFFSHRLDFLEQDLNNPRALRRHLTPQQKIATDHVLSTDRQWRAFCSLPNTDNNNCLCYDLNKVRHSTYHMTKSAEIRR